MPSHTKSYETTEEAYLQNPPRIIQFAVGCRHSRQINPHRSPHIHANVLRLLSTARWTENVERVAPAETQKIIPLL